MQQSRYQTEIYSVHKAIIRRRAAEQYSNVFRASQQFLCTWLETNFGREEILSLCERYNFEASEVLAGFNEFLISNGRITLASLKPLLDILYTVPISTAECERGFSQMNLISSDLRSSLTTRNLSNLMFIKLNGPHFENWSPSLYVKR